MPDAPPTTQQSHSVTIDGTTYLVTASYAGTMTLLELLKLTLKRDMERQE